MPTYEYICEKCGHEFEQFQSMKDDSLTKCPACSKKALKRKIGIGAGIIFKGSGFYCTDYRSPASKAASESESSEKVSTSADSTKKTSDNKTA